MRLYITVSFIFTGFGISCTLVSVGLSYCICLSIVLYLYLGKCVSLVPGVSSYLLYCILADVYLCGIGIFVSAVVVVSVVLYLCVGGYV